MFSCKIEVLNVSFLNIVSVLDYVHYSGNIIIRYLKEAVNFLLYVPFKAIIPNSAI